MKNIWVQSLIITVAVFGSLWFVNKLTDLKLFTAFDTIGTALKDFQITDYAFSQLRPRPSVDDRIVIVNFGNLDRRGVAEQIRLINAQKPRVVAIDALYNCEGGLRDSVNCAPLLDTLGNLLLSMALEETENLVLAHKLLQSSTLSTSDNNEADSLEYSDQVFNRHAKNGFVNIPTDAAWQDDIKMCRTIWPKFNVKGKSELAFSTQIAMQYDSAKAKRYLMRNKDEEIVNFRGNIEVIQLRIKSLKNDDTGSSNYPTMFTVVDVYDLQDDKVAKDVFKDKIVIMGFLGGYLGDPSWGDKFFTPLNKKVAGRANPDMFGVVVHANIVAMILNEDYINELPDWLLIAIAFVICTLTVALLITIDHKLPSWFDALSFFVQIVILLILTAIMIQAFAQLSLKLDLGLTIGVIALVGPVYDVFKSLQNEYNKRFTKPKPEVLKET